MIKNNNLLRKIKSKTAIILLFALLLSFIPQAVLASATDGDGNPIVLDLQRDIEEQPALQENIEIEDTKIENTDDKQTEDIKKPVETDTYEISIETVPQSEKMISATTGLATMEMYFTFDVQSKTITSYSLDPGAPKNVVIPQTIGGVQVLHIGDNSFAGRQLTSVEIPMGILTIGKNAFYNNPSITSIVVPDSVTGIGTSAFARCSGMTSVTLSNTLTAIGEEAFYECTKLISIVIPDGITIINNSTFANCSSLISVTIPNSVTAIGQYAFYFCFDLPSIDIPNNVISIGSSAFWDTYSLKKINIPDKNSGAISGAPWGNDVGVVYWKDVVDVSPFVFNTTSKQVVGYIGTGGAEVIPANFNIEGMNYDVIGISGRAFYNKTTITKITISEGISSIGGSAFENCTALTSITIPNSVTTIGQSAFYFCSKLPLIDIPDSVISIGSSAFLGTSSLKKINIPSKNSGAISGAPWSNDVGVVYWKDVVDVSPFVFNTTSKQIVKYIGTGGAEVIPANFDIEGMTYIVMGIGNNAFYNQKTITEITISEGITSIGNSAFENCTSLTSITIPDSVTTMGRRAFYYCSKINIIPLGSNLKDISTSSFGYCTALTSIIIPDNITRISSDAFIECPNLKKIDIQTKKRNSITGAPWRAVNAVVYWKDFVFFSDYVFDPVTGTIVEYLGDKDTVNIPDSFVVNGSEIPVLIIGAAAFNGKTAITSVTIPNSVTMIEQYAFSRCDNLISISISNSVTIIEQYAFSFCNNLTSISIPNSVKSIEQHAFYNCTAMTSITMFDGITSIGSNAFENCSNLTSIIIPDSVINLEEYAFYRCRNLATVTLSKNLTILQSSVFSGCSNLISIDVPDSVTSIEYDAFYGTTKLKNISISKNIKCIDKTIFGTSSPLALIFIREYAVNVPNVDVKNNSPWGAKAGTTVRYLGEIVTFSHTLTEDVAECKIDISAYIDKNMITFITLPNGTIIDVGGLRWPVSDTYTYTVTANGTYIFKGRDDTGLEVEYPVVITNIVNYTVTFNDNYIGAPAIQSATVIAPATTATLPTTPTRTGWTFTGWNTAIDGTGTKFDAATTVTGNISVFAMWETTVTFSDNYTDTPTISSAKVATPATTAVLPTAPTRTGWTFTGWNTAADGTGTKFDATTTVTGNISVFAMWETTVTFSGNYTNAPVISSAKVITPATTAVLPTAPTRTGWTFTGWNTAADGTGTKFDATTTVTAGISVFAMWEIIEYKITYILHSGTNDAGNPKTYTVETLPITLIKPTYIGYTFKGWIASDGLNGIITEIPKGTTGAITLTADWTINTYTITFKAGTNGNLTGGNSQTVSATHFSTWSALTLPTPVAGAGYTFSNWTINDTVIPGSSVITGDITAVANFTPVINNTPNEVPEIIPITTTTPPPPKKKKDNVIVPKVVPEPVKEDVKQVPIKAVEAIIEDTKTPTAKPEEIEPVSLDVEPTGVWALSNLILSFCSVILGVLLLITPGSKEPRLSFTSIQDERQKKMNIVIRLTGILTSLAAPIIFFATSNITDPMIIMDRWTVVITITSCIALMFTIISLKKGLFSKKKQRTH